MKKIIIYDNRAIKEFNKFNIDVQREFGSLIETLSKEGYLDFPDAKRINKDLFEIRVKQNGEYRGIYAYIVKNNIIILSFFRKKTQKTPQDVIKTSTKRLKRYEI